MHVVSNQPDRSCPECRLPLQRNGDLWQCAVHGDFFSYGPRRLMRVSAPVVDEDQLLPWQTLTEAEPTPSPLAAAPAATK